MNDKSHDEEEKKLSVALQQVTFGGDNFCKKKKNWVYNSSFVFREDVCNTRWHALSLLLFSPTEKTSFPQPVKWESAMGPARLKQ